MIVMSRMPVDEAGWEQLVRGLLKAHLKLAGMSYEDLSNELAAIGVDESEPAIRAKINRGRFTAIFLLQCLRAMGVGELLLPSPADRPPTQRD